jgi:predicted short-subunit dehydrogenase-like oxidoreductase (DUF2520 family)
MFTKVRVVGRGRVGSAVAARLEERGLALVEDSPHLVLLCVPDSAIRDVARTIATGPWIAHVSGATPLAALAPHTRRFGVHPLQTFTRARGPEQIDGAWGAITAETDDAQTRAIWVADLLGLRPFVIAAADRVLYHAGAVIASNYLVTLYRCASQLLSAAGAPPAALVPLMQRTIENGFDLTGPIARGDRATVDAHLREITKRAPELEPMYRALASATLRRSSGQDLDSNSGEALDPSSGQALRPKSGPLDRARGRQDE